MLRRRRWFGLGLHYMHPQCVSSRFLSIHSMSPQCSSHCCWCFSGFLITWKYRDNPNRVLKRNHIDMWSESRGIQVCETKLQHLRNDVALKHAEHGEKIPIITNIFLTSPESTLKVLAVNLFHPHSTQKIPITNFLNFGHITVFIPNACWNLQKLYS